MRRARLGWLAIAMAAFGSCEPAPPSADGGLPPGVGDGGTSPPAARFQPAFNNVLRSSESLGLQTVRLKLPVARAGTRVRATFRAGDGALRIHRVTLAKAGAGGALASAPVELTFDGAPSASLTQQERRTSDPVPFDVTFGDELYVSMELEGQAAVADVVLFPDSFARWGHHAAEMGPIAGQVPRLKATALATLEVEAPPSLAFLAIGDSITEGYVHGSDDDYRNGWTHVAERALGLPVANAGVSSQGVADVLTHFEAELAPLLGGVTDCLTLLGTNNLASRTAEQIIASLEQLYARLAPGCRVWAGTLLPKERTSTGDLAEVQARRLAVNAWIRGQTHTFGVIDFEAVLLANDSLHDFLPGTGQDGIHPSKEGQRLLGEAAAERLGGLPDLEP
jgi:lysophospholipase L1-like esterase